MAAREEVNLALLLSRGASACFADVEVRYTAADRTSYTLRLAYSLDVRAEGPCDSTSG